MTETPKVLTPQSHAVAAPESTQAAKPTRSPEQAAKAQRLASALRDNLKRRKAAHRPSAKPGH